MCTGSVLGDAVDCILLALFDMPWLYCNVGAEMDAENSIQVAYSHF